MELNYRTASGRLTFKLVGDTQKAIFKELASIQDTFEAESCCGVCGAEYKFQLRITGDRGEFEYFELVCKNPECRAKFSFGQSKDQKTLFPKRKDDDDNWLPFRGWVKWDKTAKEQHAAPAKGR